MLDEPGNDLDPGHRKKLLHLLQGLTTGWIIISHDFDFLRQSCTTFMSIEGHRLCQADSLQLHQHVHAHPLGNTEHDHG